MHKSRFFLLSLGLAALFLSWGQQQSNETKIKNIKAEILDVQQDLDEANAKLQEARTKQGWLRTILLDIKEVDELEKYTEVLRDRITEKKKELADSELASVSPILIFLILCAFLAYMKLRKRRGGQVPRNHGGSGWPPNKKRSGVKAWRAQSRRLSSLLNCDLLIIDSNIWMNSKYEEFFETLKSILMKSGKIMPFPGSQFDEICNIKLKTKYEEPRNASARYAINKIETFQREGLLNIVSDAMKPDRHAYADPVILKLIAANAKNGKSLVFITNDIELRIRARQVLKDASNVNYELVEIDTEFANLL